MARRNQTSPDQRSRTRIVKTIQRSNYYLKLFLMGCFLFLLGTVFAYQFLRRVPIKTPSEDLRSDKLPVTQVTEASPSTSNGLDTQISDYGSFNVRGKITPVAAKTTSEEVFSGPVYVVQKGDSLWKIAQSTSGDPYHWIAIYSQNQQLIGPNPGIIYPGMLLNMPVSTQVRRIETPVLRKVM